MKSLKKRWRRFEVRLQGSARFQKALQKLFGAYIDFVFKTTKWEKIGLESFEADIARGVPRVLCCWHNRLAMTPYLRDWSDHKLTIVASMHADGRVVSQALKDRGIEVIELATSDDNRGSIRDMVRSVRKGGSLGFTVDGPLGPSEVAKPGAVVVAGLAGVEVSPVTYAVSRSFRLKTWDRFIVPLPYGRGVLAVGDGFHPPKKLPPDDLETATEQLGRLIADLTERCEAGLKNPKA